VLFTFLSERYERRSVAISTTLVFSDSNRVCKDPMTTMAAIDRVVHHSVILDLVGMDSYRAREANDRRGSTPSPTSRWLPLSTNRQPSIARRSRNQTGEAFLTFVRCA